MNKKNLRQYIYKVTFHFYFSSEMFISTYPIDCPSLKCCWTLFCLTPEHHPQFRLCPGRNGPLPVRPAVPHPESPGKPHDGAHGLLQPGELREKLCFFFSLEGGVSEMLLLSGPARRPPLFTPAGVRVGKREHPEQRAAPLALRQGV